MKHSKHVGYVFLLLAVLCASALFLYSKQEVAREQPILEPVPETHKYETFSGNVVPFELADLWVLSNDGSRSLESLLQFFNARAGGLHFEYRSYAKKNKIDDELMLGIFMRINAEGIFDSTAVSFTESQNAELANRIVDYIRDNFRYRKATGSTQLILPIRFKKGK